MFAKTVKSAAVAGTYKELVEDVMPEWLNAGFGFKYTKNPSTEAATRTHHFKTTNCYGSESECYLFSVEHDQDVEAKVKNLKASLIYFIELSNFKSRKVFDATISQLRSDTVPYEHQLWVADTNPPEDGEDSWIHDLFFKVDVGSELPVDIQEMLQREIKEMVVLPKDNPFLDDRQWAFLRGSYAHSKDLTDRYIEGKWIKDMSNGHFAQVFVEDKHVVGKIDTPRETREVIMPSEFCSELITGFDPGDVWMSAHIVEKVYSPFGSVYCVLDELYNDGEQISTKEFTEAWMEKIEFYEEYVRTKYNREITWRHWSDNAANNNFKAAAGAFESNVVFQSSGGKIRLLSAPKGAGSVKRRVNITKLLLHEDRLFISANCTGCIDMIKSLKKGKGALNFVPRTKYKHRFDSLSYIFDAEEPVDVLQRFPNPKKSSGVIFVG